LLPRNIHPWDKNTPKTTVKAQINPKILSFVNNLVRDILQDKRQKNLVFPDGESTAPNSPSELEELIISSFETINESWKDIFSKLWKEYIPPKLVLYTGHTTEDDVDITNEIWPCYIPKFEKIFIDPDFFNIFKKNFYPGSEDFTIFYIIAHEVAHYVQDILFWAEKIAYEHNWGRYQRDLHSVIDLRDFSLLHHNDSSHQAEQIVEIHADFLTWVVTHHANKKSPFLHENDIREWIETAIAIWDDMIRFRAWKHMSYESFKHWRCDQRALAFANWLKYGNISRFSLWEIAQIFIKQGINSPAEVTISMFNRLARKWE